MADKVVVKMFSTGFLFVFILNVSLSLVAADTEDKCSCYNVCNKNFTTNSIHDAQKISACQRGCRFFLLVLHKTRDMDRAKGLENAKEGCLLSCSESYFSSFEVSACKFGCSATELPGLCNSVEIHEPQIGYSFMIAESDILIHAGEPEPDDILTDPGLRKQIQKKLIALVDVEPKIPEIHFRNLPVKAGKVSDLPHANFKCPKFYGLDSKLEFRNGKIIIGDLYLFIGVFIFVVLCFLLGNHIETKTMKNQCRGPKFYLKEEFDDRDRLLQVDSHEGCGMAEEGSLPYCDGSKSKMMSPGQATPEEFEGKFEGVTLVFQEEDIAKENKTGFDNSLKI